MIHEVVGSNMDVDCGVEYYCKASTRIVRIILPEKNRIIRGLPVVLWGNLKSAIKLNLSGALKLTRLTFSIAILT